METWNEDTDYVAAKNIVHSLRVVNDIAERGVALMKEYNKLITTNKEQKQYLLLLVKEYIRKSTLILTSQPLYLKKNIQISL